MALPYLSDREPEWLDRLRSGDRSAFEALFRGLAPGLCAFVTRYVGSSAVAEELVQDLFLELWVKRDRLSIDRALTSYLFSAARNRAMNHLRRERRLVCMDDAQAQSGDAGGADPSAPDESEILEALELQDAIDRLPPRCRLIFTLNRQQGMSYDEIASTLNLSRNTVETQMGRALRSLRDRLRHLLP